MTTNNPIPDKQTIVLTGRPPVRITLARWMHIAGSMDYYDDGPSIAVRQHADGRAVVYGRHNRCNSAGGMIAVYQDGHYFKDPADPAAIIDGIKIVAVRLHNRAGGDWHPYDELIAETISQLHPEDID